MHHFYKPLTRLAMRVKSANFRMQMARGFGSGGQKPEGSDPSQQSTMEKSLEDFLASIKSHELKDSMKQNPEEMLGKYMKEKFVVLSLINAQTVEEVENILSNCEIEKLSIDEISLFLFYLGDFEGPIYSPAEINTLIDLGLKKMNESPTEVSSANLIKSLGILCVKKGFKLNDEQTQIILNVSSKLAVSDDTILELMKAFSYILAMNGHDQLYKATILRFLQSSGEEILMSKKFSEPVEISEVLYFLFSADYHNESLVESLVGQLLQKEIDVDTAVNTIIALSNMKYSRQSTYDQLLKLVVEHMDQIPVNSIVPMLEACIANDVQSIPITKIISAITQNAKYMSIDAYVEMWRLLAVMKKKGTTVNLDPTIAALKRNFGGSNWSLKDFEVLDHISVLSSLSSLRDNDLAFAHSFIQQLAMPEVLDTCHGTHLFMITKLFYNYSKIYEQAFQLAHNACAHRMDQIPPEYRQHLQELFKLRKDILPPTSPFFSV